MFEKNQAIPTNVLNVGILPILSYRKSISTDMAKCRQDAVQV